MMAMRGWVALPEDIVGMLSMGFGRVGIEYYCSTGVEIVSDRGCGCSPDGVCGFLVSTKRALYTPRTHSLLCRRLVDGKFQSTLAKGLRT